MFRVLRYDDEWLCLPEEEEEPVKAGVMFCKVSNEEVGSVCYLLKDGKPFTGVLPFLGVEYYFQGGRPLHVVEGPAQ
jgi:hypothetical protein